MGHFSANGITGHRGNQERFPENTLSSFIDALRVGVDWIELDVRLSRDDRILVIHDETTSRTCDVDLTVNSASGHDLRQLNAAASWNRRNPDKPPRHDHIPYLEEVLKLIKNQSKTRVSIQPKVDCVVQVCAMLKKMNMAEYAGFNDGNPAILRKSRELLPEAVIFYDIGQKDDVPAAIETARQYAFYGIVIEQSQITPDGIKAVAGAGLEPGVWTVNELDQFHQLRRMGVKRFYTDRPEEFLRAARAEL
ncbi:MAG: glycerophosphodiester phosphodiesterase family protein [Victivallaceae bacterium]|nr:glycerophosphodiester phosphodiesterase family protein [Victivallaceae bacterium]